MRFTGAALRQTGDLGELMQRPDYLLSPSYRRIDRALSTEADRHFAVCGKTNPAPDYPARFLRTKAANQPSAHWGLPMTDH